MKQNYKFLSSIALASALLAMTLSCNLDTPSAPELNNPWDPNNPNPPRAPTSLTATALNSTQIRLMWKDMSGNEKGFRIERKDGDAGSWAEIDSVAANDTTYLDSGLVLNTYNYRVQAFNTTGSSAYANEASATTFLNAPSNLTATALNSTQIRLQWQDNSGDEQGFKIERKSESDESWTERDSVSAGVTAYLDSGLVLNAYNYRIRAFNTAGASAYSNEISATTFLNAPSNLTATALNSTQIRLQWQDNSSDERGFRIERKAGDAGSWAEIDSLPANEISKIDTGLVLGITYFYRVRAFNTAESSGYSNESATPTILFAPSDLGATALSSTQVQLDWHDNSEDEEGFRIERKIGVGGRWAQIFQTLAGVTLKIDTGLSVNTNYNYRVSAFNTLGTSAYSNEASAILMIQWQKTFGGASDDFAMSVLQTADGGFIVAGETDSHGPGNQNAYLIKTDDEGNEIWENSFGASRGSCSAYSVQQTTDGGYILAGFAAGIGAGELDAYLVKTDAAGNEMWHQTFGGASWDEAYSVLETADGYIIAGATQSLGAGYYDAYLIRTDNSGNEIWQRTFGGTGDDGAGSICLTADGGYMLAGGTDSFGAGSHDVYLIKTDAQGNEEWYNTFGGSGEDGANCIQQTTDGGFIVTGFTYSFGAGATDVYLVRTNGDGNEIWQKTFGGGGDDEGNCVQQTTDGGFIICGSTSSYGTGDRDVYLIRTDALGNEIWHKTFGGATNDISQSVHQTSDGGFIIAGSTSLYSGNADVYLIKTDANGNCK